MKMLLTGSTGYIGRRLLPLLLEDGHHVVCLVRDKRRFDTEDFTEKFITQLSVLEADLSDKESLQSLPLDIDKAYYLVHSMSSSHTDFGDIEKLSAENFTGYINRTTAKQIIYLSGIVNDDDLSDHLLSRKNVEDILASSHVPLTVFRAAIIIGSGSASFEIIRDLVEKLPIMIAPKWLKSKCQPIAIHNVLEYLHKAITEEKTLGRVFDIGGPDVLTYQEMLLGYATVRNLKRLIIPVPVLSPKLSAHWLYFVTSTSFSLAKSLVSSMKNEVVCNETSIRSILPTHLISYTEALQRALDKIQQQSVISSWKDAVSNASLDRNFLNYIEVPIHGCFIDTQKKDFVRSKQEAIENIWSIGGDKGWYSGNWMWRIRGLLDKMVGGVGLRRGRRSATDLKSGDALDFWRVLLADKQNGRLLLYAEMKLPGEAWLEFRIRDSEGRSTLLQTATFRPRGWWGRIYWYTVLPFHGMIFPRMIKNIVEH